MITVQVIDPKFIPQAWEMVEPMLARGLEHTDDYNIDQLKVYVNSGTWHLLAAIDEARQLRGVATVSVGNGANDRTAVITSLGGKFVVTKEVFKQVCAIAKDMGATRVQVYARDAAARLYEKIGLSKKATLMEIRL